MAEKSLRERLLAKKAKIEEALALLDVIEGLARDDDDVEPSIEIPASTTKSIAQRVAEELEGKQLTVEQLAHRLGFSEPQVRNAITGHRLRRHLKSSRVGGLTRYTIPYGTSQPGADAKGNAKPGIREAAVALLESRRGKTLGTREIANAIEGKVSTRATNFHNAVAAALSNLVKDGRIEKAGRGYRYPRPKESDSVRLFGTE